MNSYLPGSKYCPIVIDDDDEPAQSQHVGNHFRTPSVPLMNNIAGSPPPPAASPHPRKRKRQPKVPDSPTDNEVMVVPGPLLSSRKPSFKKPKLNVESHSSYPEPGPSRHADALLPSSGVVSGQSFSTNAAVPKSAPSLQLCSTSSCVPDPAIAAMGPTMSRLASTRSIPLPPKPLGTVPNHLPKAPQPMPSQPNRPNHVDHPGRIGMTPEKESHRMRAMFNVWNAEILEAKKGLKFPYTPKVPLTIVVDQLPKSLRTAAFFGKWTREASGGNDPKLIVVDTRASKVLVEFHTAQAAINAWNSPMLAPPPQTMEKGKTREDLVRVWHYIPSSDPSCLAISLKQAKKELEEGEIEDEQNPLAPPPPLLPRAAPSLSSTKEKKESKKAKTRRLRREREQLKAREQEAARNALPAHPTTQLHHNSFGVPPFDPQLMAEMFTQALNYGTMSMSMPLPMQPFLPPHALPHNMFAAPIPPQPLAPPPMWQPPVPMPSYHETVSNAPSNEVMDPQEVEDVYSFDTQIWESSNGSDAEFSDEDSDVDDMFEEDDSEHATLTPPTSVALTEDSRADLLSPAAPPPDTPMEGVTPSTADIVANPFAKAFSYRDGGHSGAEDRTDAMMFSSSTTPSQHYQPPPTESNMDVDEKVAREQELRRLVLASRKVQRTNVSSQPRSAPLPSHPSFGTMATEFITQTIDETAKQLANQERLTHLERKIAQQKLELEEAQRARAARSVNSQKRSSPAARKVPQSDFRGCWPQIPFNNFFLVLSDEEDEYES